MTTCDASTFSRSALDHLLSDGDHEVRVLSAKVADYEAVDPLEV